MPTDKQTYIRDIRPFGGGSPVTFQVDPTVTDLRAGELVGYGSASRTLVRLVRTGAGMKYVGITRDSQYGVGKLGNQAPLVADAARVGVFTTGIHGTTGTAGESYSHGDALFMAGTNTQAVTKVSNGGVQVGTVHLPDGTVKSGAVDIPMLIDEYTKTQA